MHLTVSCHLQFIRKQLPWQRPKWRSYCKQGKQEAFSSPWHLTRPSFPNRSHINRACQLSLPYKLDKALRQVAAALFVTQFSENRRIPFFYVIYESQISHLRFQNLKACLVNIFQMSWVCFQNSDVNKRRKKHVSLLSYSYDVKICSYAEVHHIMLLILEGRVLLNSLLDYVTGSN